MKHDYKKIWWNSTFIKRLEEMHGQKPATVKHGILFMIGLAVVVVVLLWRVV